MKAFGVWLCSKKLRMVLGMYEGALMRCQMSDVMERGDTEADMTEIWWWQERRCMFWAAVDILTAGDMQLESHESKHDQAFPIIIKFCFIICESSHAKSMHKSSFPSIVVVVQITQVAFR